MVPDAGAYARSCLALPRLRPNTDRGGCRADGRSRQRARDNHQNAESVASGLAADLRLASVRKSLQALARLRPRLIASGHGVPIADTGDKSENLADRLQHFANEFLPPLHGRYVAEPAVFDPNGIVSVPPPVPDPLPKTLIGVGVAAALAVGVYVAMSRQKEQGSGDA